MMEELRATTPGDPDAPENAARVAALLELETELLDLLTPDAARDWRFFKSPSFGGRRAIDLLREGDIETVLGVPLRMNLGISL